MIKSPVCQTGCSLTELPEYILLLTVGFSFPENDINVHLICISWNHFLLKIIWNLVCHKLASDLVWTSHNFVTFSCYWILLCEFFYVELRQVFLLSKISEGSTARTASVPRHPPVSEDLWKWRGDRERIWVQPRVCTLTRTATGAAGRSHSQAAQGCSRA